MVVSWREGAVDGAGGGGQRDEREGRLEQRGPASGEHDTAVRKVKRRYRTSGPGWFGPCFWSSCQISIIGTRSVASPGNTPAPVAALMGDEGKETLTMNTGVAPVGVDKPQVITFWPCAR